MPQRSVVRELDRRQDARAAQRLQRPPDTPLVYLDRLRLAGDEPLALDRAWLPADVAVPLLAADFGHTGLYDELEHRCGVRVQGGRERITAAAADREASRLLGMPDGLPVLILERLGCAGGRPVEWRESLVRADRFSVVSEWSPNATYRLDLVGGQGPEPDSAPWAAPAAPWASPHRGGETP